MTPEVDPGIAAIVSGGRVSSAIEVSGVVQGVGFRPFIWRLASELGLDGSVVNRAGQVVIEVAGPAEAIDEFVRRIRSDAPPRSRVEDVVLRPI